MHELSIAQSIIHKVEQVAKQQNLTQVRSVLVQLGAFSGIAHDSLAFCFPHVVAQSFLCSMKLKIEQVPLVLTCHHCQQQSTPKQILYLCLHCNSADVSLISGQELIIKSIEV